MFEIPEWPYVHAAPQAEGILRSRPEDFEVEEIPRVQPEGNGSHLWLWVEKRTANTDWVARELARVLGCATRDVGYAGLKDRHAVTRQWFSVPISETSQEDLEKARIEGVQILDSCKHTRKLKRGTLNGNRFNLKVRDFKGDTVLTEHRLGQIRLAGLPNYFGPQRFGHRGQNVEQGFKLLNKRVRLQRNKKSIYLSAIRSFLFNHVLAERVRRGDWDRMINGDLAVLDGTNSIFPCSLPDPDIEDRCKRLDIHPTGPMPGEVGTGPGAEVVQLEQGILENWPELVRVLLEQRVQASRRSLRLYPSRLEWGFEGSELNLSFVLPPGAYATTVLREIMLSREL